MRPLSLSPAPFAPTAPVFSRAVALPPPVPLSFFRPIVNPAFRIPFVSFSSFTCRAASPETLTETRVLPERTDRCVARSPRSMRLSASCRCARVLLGRCVHLHLLPRALRLSVSCACGAISAQIFCPIRSAGGTSEAQCAPA